MIRGLLRDRQVQAMALSTIGETIRALRKKRGYSQDELAELASLNRVTVAKYELGRVEPGAHGEAVYFVRHVKKGRIRQSAV